jgi:hypothetical protein
VIQCRPRGTSLETTEDGFRIVAGSFLIVRSGDDCELFLGIVRFGWRRNFRWSDLASVFEVDEVSGRSRVQLIELRLRFDPRETLRFGCLLSPEKRRFVIAALRAKLAKR